MVEVQFGSTMFAFSEVHYSRSPTTASVDSSPIVKPERPQLKLSVGPTGNFEALPDHRLELTAAFGFA